MNALSYNIVLYYTKGYIVFIVNQISDNLIDCVLFDQALIQPGHNGYMHCADGNMFII